MSTNNNSSEKSRSTLRKRGIYLLPNALTTAALFAGFYSIIAAVGERYVAAAIAVLVAGVLDGIDGRVARATNSQSEFGLYYDSMSDLISFGVAPAVLMYSWSLHFLRDIGPAAGKVGWLAAFIFTACAAMRLARFNAQAKRIDNRYFQGLASPAAAGTLVATVWFCVQQGLSPQSLAWLMALITIVLGVLMFSRLRYYSFKSLPDAEQRPQGWAFILLLLFVLLALNPPLVLMLSGALYVISGIVITLRGRQQRRQRRAQVDRQD